MDDFAVRGGLLLGPGLRLNGMSGALVVLV